MTMKWYGIHTYSGFEYKVKLSLEERIRMLGVEDQWSVWSKIQMSGATKEFEYAR